MKIRKVVLLGLGAVLISATSLAAAEKTLEQNFSQLEAEFKMLEQKETERFNQEEKIAKAAEKALADLKALKVKSVERVNKLHSMEGKAIYAEQAKKLFKDYQTLLRDVDKQQKIEERKIFEFNQLKSLR